MNNEFCRRDLFKFMVFGLVANATNPVRAQELSDFILKNSIPNPGNFKLIYSNPKLKNEFLSFLKHVYNLYPENKMHALIAEAITKSPTDQQVYAYVQERLSDIKPFLSELTYALPALSHQKEEIAKQTHQLLQRRGAIKGYLEIGTPGRYIDHLEGLMSIQEVFLVHTEKPGYSPIDIVERGQLTPIGDFIPLQDYEPINHTGLKDGSLDVVTNYIGLHHCPLHKLDSFVRSTHRALRAGGSLVLRDHDVDSVDMNAMVCLAHDVFNCGLKETWETNHRELRHFRSLKDWIAYLEQRGFKYNGRMIYQNGDPTKNALIEFVKV